MKIFYDVQNVFPRILAYYFPQFHSIPENDSVFGEGFNDWDLFKLKNNNEHLKSCKFPIDLPEGLGFYDPTLKDIRKKQGSLAKKYGVDEKIMSLIFHFVYVLRMNLGDIVIL